MGWKLCIVAARLLGLAIVVPLLTLTCLAADPVVSNVTVAQRPGTKLVDIGYDLAADGKVDISVTISADGGTTWTVPATSLTGAVGTGIVAGTGKAIVWDGGADWAGGHTAQGRVQVTASVPVPVPETEFVPIPAGTNSGTDPDSGAYSLTVSAFYMGYTEVTKATWDAVRAWGLANDYTDLPAGGGKGQDHPVHTVSWHDVVKWCNARSEKEGRTPCYTVSGSVYRTGENDSVACAASASGYRLPTETEWEYAARGGLSGKRFPWGDTITHSQANYYSSSWYSYDVSPTRDTHPDYDDAVYPLTSPVGVLAANNYGLHDMAGNLREWCWDWDPGYVGWDPGYVGSYRVLRGGGWGEYANDCRSASRHGGYPDERGGSLGFRVCFPGPEFALIPGGTNSGTDPDSGAYSLTVSAFYMGRTEVTKATWDAVRAWGLANDYTDLPAGEGKEADHPVHTVSWHDVVKWCNARSEKEGLTPCYTVSGSVYKTGESDSVACAASASGYRLPTETEWEYAARGGLSGKRFPWGDTITHSQANYYSWSSYIYDVSPTRGYHPDYDDGVYPPTSPAGVLAANNFGLHDMAGNLREWCWDWDPGYVGSDRVLRGGGWGDLADYCRSAERDRGIPYYRDGSLGFRVCFPSPETEFALIPGGTNSGTDPDSGAYSLTVSAFYMGHTEVTKATWDAVRAWGLANGYTDLTVGIGKEADHPVHTVSWHDVVKWCNARSEKEGRTPCYTVSGSVYRTGENDSVACAASASGYRLPTETEWEYAARGGLSAKRFPWGDTITHSQANYHSSSWYSYDVSPTRGLHPDYYYGDFPYTSPVGALAANNYGLHDMAGNLWEWCWDWDPGYVGSVRVQRGGGWGDDAEDCRSASRYGGYPDDRIDHRGFRVCFPAPETEFALIPGGTNSGTDPDSGAYSLTVSAFCMGRTEVTKATWDAVRAWGLANDYTDLPAGEGKGQEHPVHTVSWYDVVKWCNARSEKEGLTPCYTVSGSVYKTGESDSVACAASASGYRLPTETEWEYAARGGLSGKRFPWGDTIAHSQANYYSSSSYGYDVSPTRGYHPDYYDGGSPYTSPAGVLAANNYGLHDMAGNLREWCWDWDPGHVGSDRVLRGGNWSYYAEDCRSASRYGGYPGDRSYYGGFRVCFPAPESGIVSLDFRDYTLTVASAHATPTPAVGPHTYAWHATVTCTVTDASSTHDPTGWTGTGSVPATGTALTTGALLLDEVGGSTASSIAWEWSEAPAADDDAYTTPEDTPLTVIAPGVLANDTDAEDDPLTAAKLTDPAHGTVTLQADGSFVYTPAAEYSGTDSFTYKANDGHGDSAPATVTFTVSPTNDPPTNTVLPTVTGTTMVGSVLTADKGTWNDGIDTTPGALSYTYQWRRADDGVGTNAADIAGATDAAYTLQNGDAGAYVAVRVTAKDNGEGTPAIQSMAAESVWTSIPRWGLAPGNPIQGVWTIYLESATLQPTGGTAAVLTAGDEIAVFQGDRQVGWTTLTASLDGGFDVYVKAFAELGDGSTGYEPGEPYEIRCWDISERIESAKFIGTYPKPGEYEGTVFPAGGSAVSAMDLVFYEDATPPEITISAPSVDLTASGPVTYTVTYADAGTLTVTLATGDITLVKTGTADATVAVSGSRDGATRTITLSDTVGDGTLAIEVTADTAEDDSHNLAPATGPSATFTVDNTDPVIAVDPAVVYLTVDDAAPDRLAGVTATDTNDGDVTADVAATGTVNTAVEGDYTVLYDVDDATGNAAAQASRLYRVFPTPHWTFSPGNAAEAIWTIYVESAKLDGAALTEKDEIAVYQDTLLVGWTVLTGPLDGGMDVHVKAYAELNDGSTGYVAGQPYQLKCWDNSTGAGDNVCEVVYPIAGHYEGSLFPSGTSPHSVMDLGFRTTLVLRPQMRLGFQILSAPFGPLPNPDMLVLFADHTDKIEYVRNQDADQVKYSFGQWRNNVGDWKATEAYLVKIPMDAEFEDEDAILVLEGVPVPVDTAIPLRAGFSFVPYLPDYPLAAAEAFAEILDDLDYVRDSEGNQLKFSFGQWRDNIGALQRGQGYLVKMKSPVAGFQYPGPTRRSVRTVPTACESRATTHWPFTPGNPTSDIWTIFLESATLDGTNLGAGDEIAIFQSDRLVGTTVLDGELDGGMDVSVKAFAELSDGSAGYVPGETYDIRCWRASSDTESTVFAVAYALPGGYEGTAFPSGDSAESAMDLTFTTPAPALIVTETGGTTAVQEGGATDTVSVRLATQPTGSVTVTATFGTDTEPGTRRAGTTVLTFTVGNWQTDQPLTVKAIEDAVIEGPEAEQLGLAAAGAGYAGITATVDVDVEDNDEASVAFTAATGRVGEDAEHAVCAVLSLPAGSTLAIDLTVDVAITGGTATADVDYTDWTAQSRTLIFPAGSVDGRTETAPLQTLPDAEAEADETITFEFASPSAALAVGEPATYALTIDEFGVDDAWLWILSGAACEKPTYSFGMHPDALDDSTLDDLDAPYVPGVPVDADPAIPADERAICRFALDPANPVADTRQRDIHASDEDGSTWYLVVSPSLTAGSSLAWSVPDGFPTDWTASLVEVDGDGTPMGSRAVIDMRVATELPIEADPAGAMRYFMIVCAAPEETCDLTLEPGWNLVSLPIEPTNPEVGSIFDEARVLTSARGAFRDGMSGAVVHAGTVWIWADSDGDGVYGYEATTQLHAGQGAWAFLDDAEAVTLRVGGARVANPEVLLHYGWNLIGTGTAESSVPGNAPVWDAVFLWDPLTLRYLIVDLLSPGYGHWLHCTAASYTLPLANE